MSKLRTPTIEALDLRKGIDVQSNLGDTASGITFPFAIAAPTPATPSRMTRAA
jgi:hypothetical protein